MSTSTVFPLPFSLLHSFVVRCCDALVERAGLAGGSVQELHTRTMSSGGLALFNVLGVETVCLAPAFWSLSPLP